MRTWCALIAFACAGCMPASLTFELRDDKPWLHASRPFAAVYCFDLGTAERKLIWAAICNDSKPCAESVRYGDVTLLGPVLDPTALVPNRCYLCRVMGSVRNGAAVTFEFDEAGTINRCKSHLPEISALRPRSLCFVPW